MQVGISPSEQEILSHISQHGPKTGYELGKETKYSEKTSYQGVKNLVDKELLSVSVIGKTRAGLDKKEYHLTILGLSHALTLTRSEDWNPIIKSWGHLLPHVLKKLYLFVNAELWDLAWMSLSLTAYEFCKSHWSDVELSKSVANELGESWRDALSLMRGSVDKVEKFELDFYSAMFKLNLYWGIPKDRDRLGDVCKSDLEVRDYLVKGYMKAKDFLRSDLDLIERVIQKFNRDDKV